MRFANPRARRIDGSVGDFDNAESFFATLECE
jgi:hypothetical protein